MRKIYLALVVLSCLLFSTTNTRANEREDDWEQSVSLLISGTVENVSCNGGNDGSIDISVPGGTPPYSYSWSTGATSQDINHLTAGAYSVTVTDANGTIESQTYTITEPAPLDVSVTTTGANCTANNGSASATASGGTPPYSYVWSSGGTGPNESGLGVGVYYVVATDANGCSITEQFTVNNTSNQPFTATFTLNPVTCDGGSNGSVTVSPTLGGNSYLWSNGATTQTVTGLEEGWYTVLVTHPNTCALTFSVYVPAPDPITLSSYSTVTNVSCFGGSDGSVTAAVSGGNAPYTYSWNTSPVQTTATISGLSVGTYIVNIVDSMGCTASDTVTITSPPALSASITSSTPPTCGNTNGTATVTASGGVPGYAYTWNTSPPQSSATATGLGAGPHEVSVMDANGCFASASVTLIPPSTLAASVTSTNASCSGGNDGTATVSATGGSGSYTYSWSTNPVQTGATATGLAAGSYSVTVTDGNGCITISEVTITEPAPLTASITSLSHVSCNGGANGWATASASGGTGGYFYSWSSNPPQVTATANGLTAGSYTVTITDSNNCSATAWTTISQPSALAATVTTTNALCNGGATGTATVSASGGTPGYSYSWNTNPPQTGATATGLAAGVYPVTVTDSMNCTLAFNVTVEEPQQVTASVVSSTNVSCAGGSDGSATVMASGGAGAYSYSWNSNPVQTTQSATGLSSGTYTVTVTDGNGCTASDSIYIKQPNPLTAAITSVNVSCSDGSDGSATVTASGGTGPYTYAWNTTPAQHTATASGLPAGVYAVTVTDEFQCEVTDTIRITQPDPLIASIASSGNASCFGSSDGVASVNVTGGTPGYTYSWYPSGGAGSSAGSLAAGSYTVTVTDSNSCAATAQVTITEPQALTLSFAVSNYNNYSVSCSGSNDGFINLSGNGGTAPYSCAWTGPNGFTSSSFNLSNLEAGTYPVTVTDANGCQNSVSITLTPPAALTSVMSSPSVTGGYNIACNGGSTGSIDLTADGGVAAYSYSWTGPNGYASSSEDPSNVTAGTYIVTITDVNGCSLTDSITLTEPAMLTVSTTSSSYAGGYNIGCNGDATGTIDAAAAGGTPGYSYSWFGPADFSSATAAITSVYAGTYSLSVTDANGCTTSQTITLTEPMPMQMTSSLSQYNGNNISCNGASDGSIDISMTGGTPAYSFAWSGPSGFTASTEDVSMLAAGTYQVTATDSNGCAMTSSITLTEPAGVNIASAQQSPSCNGSSNGSIDVTANGGVSPYTYAWSNGATTEDLAGIAAGAYSLTLTDANGCSSLLTVNLTEPAAIASAAAVTGASCAAASNGSIDVTVNGGTMPYTFAWSNGATTEDLNGVSGSSYTLSITDANGCTGSLITAVPVLYEVDVELAAMNASCYGSSTGSIDLSMVQGTSPCTFAWSNGSTSEDLSGLPAGTYSVTVTDASGCTAIGTVTLEQSDLLTSSITSPLTFSGYNLSGYQSNDGTADLTVNGGTAPYSYSWSNGETGEDLSGLAAGSYSVTVTDANGCSTTASIMLEQPLILEMPSGFSPNGDGSNDYFVVHGIEAFPDNTIIVFNRWGNQVFEKNGYSNDWAGTNNKGEELPDGTYFVILKVNNTDITLTGYVDLRRH